MKVLRKNNEGCECESKTGKRFMLFTPFGKSKRFAAELHAGANVVTGEVLAKNQKSYRAGYMACRNDEAKAWKSKSKGIARIDVRVPNLKG